MDSFQPVHDKLFRNHSDDFTLRWNSNDARRLQHAIDVDVPDLAVFIRYGDNSVTRLKRDMIAGYSDVYFRDFYSNHAFRMVNRFANGLNRLVDIYDRTFSNSLRVSSSNTDDIDRSVVHLTDDHADFGCTNVQTDDDVIAAQPEAPPISMFSTTIISLPLRVYTLPPNKSMNDAIAYISIFHKAKLNPLFS